MNNENKSSRYPDTAVEIDLLELFFVLLRWLWLIALVAVIAGAVVYCYSKFAIPEQFQSSTKVYMLNRTESGSDMPTTQDLQVGTQLSQDYAQMITSRYVLESVIKDLGLPYSYEGLKGLVNVSRPNDSRIIQITVTNTDPQQAQIICRAVREAASRHIQSVMDIDAINVVDDANLPTHKSAPNNTKNAMIGALIGGIIVIAVVVIRYLLDDTVKTREDVEEKLGISCLALIPLDEGMNVEGAEKTKKKKRFPPRGINLRFKKKKRVKKEA